jgi:hypothetical protein
VKNLTTTGRENQSSPPCRPDAPSNLFAPLDIGNSSFTIGSMDKKHQPTPNEIIEAIKKAKKSGILLKYAEDAKKKGHPLAESRNKYNDLTAFDFTDKDMEEIKKLNNFPDLLANDRQWTPLEKFLYAVHWKDSKLDGIKSIIEGMESDGSNASPPKKSAFVYYYFGRHLRNRIKEPMVDRHTLHAFRLIKNGGTEVSSKPTLDDAKECRAYFLEIYKKEKLTSYKEARLIDSLFFALGRYAGKYAKNHPAS